MPGSRVRDAVRVLEWNGQTVIDATNDFDGADLNGTTSSELLATLVPGARVVKAANTLRADVLAADPHDVDGQRVMFVSGDDAEARSQVATLFEEAGFSTIDLGDLATGGALQQVGGPLAGADLIRLPAASCSRSLGRSGRNCLRVGSRDPVGARPDVTGVPTGVDRALGQPTAPMEGVLASL